MATLVDYNMRGMPRRGEIWMVNFGETFTDVLPDCATIRGRRPAVIVQTRVIWDGRLLVTVIPITSFKHGRPPRFTEGGDQIVIAPPEGGVTMASTTTAQILTVDRRQLARRCGSLYAGTMARIDGLLATAVGLP